MGALRGRRAVLNEGRSTYGRLLLGVLVLFLVALAGVCTAGRLSPGYTLDLGPGEWGRLQGFYDWEDNGLYTYRWTTSRARIRLPVLGAPRRLTLRLDGSRPPAFETAAVTLWLDGRPALRIEPAPGPHLYHLVYEAPSAWRWESVLELRTETFQPPGDARHLGGIVDRLHASRPLRPTGLLWPLVLLWSAVGLAALALSWALGWPLEAGLALGLSLELLLSLLLARFLPAVLPWAGLLLGVLLGAALVGRLFRGRSALGWARSSRRRERPWAPFALACLLLALVLALLHLLTPYLPVGGSWALQVLEPFYAPAGPFPRSLLRWLPLLAVACAAIPRFNRDLRRLVRGLIRLGHRLAPRLRPPGRWLLLGLLFVPLGYALRSRVLWGDGPHLIAHIGAGYRFKEAEILAFFSQATLYQWAERLWGWRVEDVYVLSGVVLGALYVALAAALSEEVARGRFGRVAAFALLATLATVQFGFGYLENYTFVTVALLALFWQMLRVLRGRGRPALVLALWVLACACHLQALLVGPAVLYTLVRAWQDLPAGAPRRLLLGRLLLAGALPLLALVALLSAGGYDWAALVQGGWTRGNNPYVLVPLRSPDGYSLFSLRHLANLLNEHLLVAPVVLPLLALLVLWAPRRVPWRDPALRALLLAAVGLLLFASLMYPDLGAAMDWDLFAPVALPYTLLCGYLLDRVVADGEAKRYGVTVLLVYAAVHAALWVLLNARMI
ncbi:MAG: hypothetical protein JXA37_07865 [Chloroflexia bacterium]|nr:hypothetical protein [Chloroflexia bacterium]